MYIEIDLARKYAISKHEEVNQMYDDLPYSYHLEMCIEMGYYFININHGYIEEKDVHNVISAIWCHDLIEDARVTYNDLSKRFGPNVADIVYACTNEKGRNRKERANEKFYNELRQNRLAVYVKLCDRLANMKYSASKAGSDMALKYASEADEFLHNTNACELYPLMATAILGLKTRIISDSKKESSK